MATHDELLSQQTIEAAMHPAACIEQLQKPCLGEIAVHT
jgi:hypothetical protein